ncbi:hypothetical protein FRB99_003535 [Tulasnella sp. 403]|nr:hypothetical protein FRB99_003535 [Tulasnella sp. 403]
MPFMPFSLLLLAAAALLSEAKSATKPTYYKPPLPTKTKTVYRGGGRGPAPKIVVIIVFSIVGALLLAFILWILYKKYKERKAEKESEDEKLERGSFMTDSTVVAPSKGQAESWKKDYSGYGGQMTDPYAYPPPPSSDQVSLLPPNPQYPYGPHTPNFPAPRY